MMTGKNIIRGDAQNMRKDYMLFGDPAVNLFIQPIAGSITTNTTWSGRVDLVTNTTVSSGVTLTIEPGTEVIFHNGVELTVNGKILADCSNDDPAVFKGETCYGGGVRLTSNTHIDSKIINCQFEMLEYGIGMNVTSTLTNEIEDNTFTDCEYGVYAYNTGTSILNNDFSDCNETAIKLVSFTGDCYYNTIELGTNAYGIWVESSTTADVRNNEIENNTAGSGDIGIYVYLSTGANFDDNTITGAGVSGFDCNQCNPYLTDNIFQNGGGKGMRLYHAAKPIMNTGNDAQNRIADNDEAEIYINGYIFPDIGNGSNDICDEDDPATPANPGEYLIEAYFDEGDLPQGGYVKTVESNFWYADGGALDDTSEIRSHIFPANLTRFKIWILSYDNATNTGYSTTSFTPTADELYHQATEFQYSGEYEEAYDIFASIIEDYPGDATVVSAGQNLFACAIALDMDISEVEDYFANLAISGSEFEKNWLDMVSYCQIEQYQFSEAIAYYESIIEDTTASLPDSVYAVIDAGAAYLRAELSGIQIQSVGGSQALGTIASLCPINQKEYSGKVKSLLQLIDGGGDNSETTIVLPSEFVLFQNYPNPFNPTTFIKYDLPELSKVKLEIYNILGQKVVTLVDGVEQPGFKSVKWAGNNNNGGLLSSGMYIYRISAEGIDSGKKFNNCKKMLLIK